MSTRNDPITLPRWVVKKMFKLIPVEKRGNFSHLVAQQLRDHDDDDEFQRLADVEASMKVPPEPGIRFTLPVYRSCICGIQFEGPTGEDAQRKVDLHRQSCNKTVKAP